MKKMDGELRHRSGYFFPGRHHDGGDVQKSNAMIAIVQGEDLDLIYCEEKLLVSLGYSETNKPTSIYDWLNPSLIAHHRRWVEDTIRSNKLPERLLHPLRSVEVKHRCGFYVRMDLVVQWMEDTEIPTFKLFFGPFRCGHKQTFLKRDALQDVHVGSAVEHDEAVVMMLDIVEFTKACSKISAPEVSLLTQFFMKFED
jgi:hypothetical protein